MKINDIAHLHIIIVLNPGHLATDATLKHLTIVFLISNIPNFFFVIFVRKIKQGKLYHYILKKLLKLHKQKLCGTVDHINFIIIRPLQYSLP